MTKTQANKIINLLLYLLFCALIGTGLIMEFKLPPGSRGGHGLSIFSMNRHQWGDIHLYIGYLLIALTVIHLWLNWQWLKNVAANRKLWPILTGLAAGLILLAGLLLLPVERGAGEPGGEHGPGQGKGLGRALQEEGIQ